MQFIICINAAKKSLKYRKSLAFILINGFEKYKEVVLLWQDILIIKLQITEIEFKILFFKCEF